jgi:LPXTG-motif cell wall-anchored protein
VTVTAAQRVYAIWTELGSVTISYISNDIKLGKVSRANEFLNPKTGAAQGSTAIPEPGCEFVRWLDENGDTASYNAELIPSKGPDGYTSGAYTAEFRKAASERDAVLPKTYTVTAAAGTGGSVTPGGTVTVSEGASLTVLINLDQGYSIADVIVDGKSVGAVSSYTFADILRNHTLFAVVVYSVDIPKTGDEQPPAALLFAMGSILAGAALFASIRKRCENNKASR